MNKKYVFFIALAVVSIFALFFNNPVHAQLSTPTVPTRTTDATVTVQGTPRLVLSYDIARKESALTATFDIVVRGNRTGINIANISDVSFSNVSINAQGSKTSYFVGNISPITPVTTIRDNVGKSYYVVPVGATRTFHVVSVATPSKMFAGTYYATLGSLYGVVGTGSLSNNDMVPLMPHIVSSNMKVIVGELSPYITSVVAVLTPNPLITVTGQRLNNTSVTIDGNPLSGVAVLVSTDGKSLSFAMPPMYASGAHLLSVNDNATGQSNVVQFQVVGSNQTGSAQISNTSTVLAQQTCDSAASICTQPVTFAFDVTAGNNPIFLSKSVTDMGNLSPNSSIVFAAGGNIVPSNGSFAAIGDSLNDTPSYYYIAPGTSRSFGFSGMFDSSMCPTGYSCSNIVSQIAAINYGTNSTNLSAYSITSGLDNLKAIVSFPGSPTPPVPTSAPVVRYIYPTTATPLTSVSIYGSGFYNLYTMIGINGPSSFPSSSPNSISSDGTRMSVLLPPSILPGQYAITASNLVNGRWVRSLGHAVLVVTSSPTTNLPPVISSVTSPTTLSVNQSGTWSVNASDPENRPLSYSVDWGDVRIGMTELYNTPESFTQTSTFTHSYSSAGNYTVTITVRDSAGLTAKTSSTVQVGTLVTTSPVITVISPNGGENWQVRANHQITWSTAQTSGLPSPTQVMIELEGPSFNCIASSTCPDSIYRVSGNVANTGSYKWRAGELYGGNEFAPAGSYRVKICTVSTSAAVSICDNSDAWFTVTPGSVITPVTPPEAPMQIWGPTVASSQTNIVKVGDVAQFTSTRGGSYVYDCGTGGTLSGQTDHGTFNCTYSSAGSKIVKITKFTNDVPTVLAQKVFNVLSYPSPSTPAPTLTLSATPTARLGGNVIIAWNTTNVTSCNLTGTNGNATFGNADGPVRTIGSIQMTQLSQTEIDHLPLTLTVTCTGAGGRVSKSVTIARPVSYVLTNSISASVWDALKKLF